MAPAELLNDYVPVQQDFADVDWVVAADFVIRHALVLAGIVVLEKVVANEVFHRNEVKFVIGHLTLIKVDVGYRVAH